MGEAAGYRWALRASALALVILAVVAVGASALWRGWPGAVAALVGVALVAVVTLTTPMVMLKAHTLPAATMAAWVGFSWLAKMALLLVAVVIIRDIEGFEKVPFALTIAVGVLTSVTLDLVAMRRARVPHVDPSTRGAST